MRNSLLLSLALALLAALAWQSMESAIERAGREGARLRSRLSFLLAFEARRKAFPRLVFFNPFGNREDDEAEGAAVAGKAVATRAALRSVTGKEPDVTETCRMEDETLIAMSRLSYRKAVAFLRALEARADLTEADKERLIDQLLDVLSVARPTTCLALLANPHAPDLVASARSGYVAAALSKLATTDPGQALTWAHKHAEIQSELVDEAAWEAVVTGAASRDMAAALRLADDLKVSWSSDLCQGLIGMAANAKEMAVLVEAVRKREAGSSSDLSSADPFGVSLSDTNTTGALMQRASRLPAEEGLRWLEESAVLPTNGSMVGLHFPPSGMVRGEIPRWMDMMAKRVNDKDDFGFGEGAQHWFFEYPEECLTWVASRPEGEARQRAMVNIGFALRHWEPEESSRWVDRLPEGTERQRTVESIFQSWRGKDPAAAAEFAKKHGIKVEEK